MLFWVDDYIFYAKESKTIDDVISSLKYDFLLEREEDKAVFLGLNIQRAMDKETVTLLQTGLIDKILMMINVHLIVGKFYKNLQHLVSEFHVGIRFCPANQL